MKIKVANTTPTQLDWMVAKCEGHEWRCPWILEKDGLAAWQSYERAWGNPTPDYSTNWAQGGPILEREKISTDWDHDAWNASIDGQTRYYTADTPLIAAMRCFVASKLGDEVDIPKELM